MRGRATHLLLQHILHVLRQLRVAVLVDHLPCRESGRTIHKREDSAAGVEAAAPHAAQGPAADPSRQDSLGGHLLRPCLADHHRPPDHHLGRPKPCPGAVPCTVLGPPSWASTSPHLPQRQQLVEVELLQRQGQLHCIQRVACGAATRAAMGAMTGGAAWPSQRDSGSQGASVCCAAHHTQPECRAQPARLAESAHPCPGGHTPFPASRWR